MVNKILVSQRLEMIEQWLNSLHKLAKYNHEQFILDNRNAAAAESYLRRCLEAIFDVGRHILAKTGSVEMAAEYKSIAKGLIEKKIVSTSLGNKLVNMAGYRNRMVHFYNMVTEDELYDVLQNNLDDIGEFVIEIKNALTVL